MILRISFVYSHILFFDKITSKKFRNFLNIKHTKLNHHYRILYTEINSSFILQSIRDFVSNEP